MKENFFIRQGQVAHNQYIYKRMVCVNLWNEISKVLKSKRRPQVGKALLKFEKVIKYSWNIHTCKDEKLEKSGMQEERDGDYNHAMV